MTQDYGWHREKARQQWIDKFHNEHNPYDCVADMHEEYEYMLDSFDRGEMEQVKFVFNHKHGTCLKVKWESGAWWDTDRVHFYYCVMLPMRGIGMLEPAALQRTKPKQRKLMWWND